MTTVTSPPTTKRANIIVPTTQHEPTSKKDNASKDKPEFVVPMKASDSNAPVGVSVSKFNRNHVVVRENFFVFFLFTS